MQVVIESLHITSFTKIWLPFAPLVELVDTLGLGPSTFGCVGSSPMGGTMCFFGVEVFSFVC